MVHGRFEGEEVRFGVYPNADHHYMGIPWFFSMARHE